MADLVAEGGAMHMLLALCIALTTVFVAKNSDKLLRKGKMYSSAFAYMALAQDTKIKKPTGELPTGKASKITIIFVRHGESTWNEVFNKKPKLMLPLRLFLAMIAELKLLLLPQGSVFLDAPLNDEGITQARQIDAFIKSSKASEYRDLLDNGFLVTSNLRRALETLLFGFKSRIQRGSPTVTMWSCLQECSRNIDTQSVTAVSEQPVPTERVQNADSTVASWYNSRVSVKEYTGNKTLKSNAGSRIMEFCEKAFKSQQTCIIVAGHSLWFRNFFRMNIRTNTGALLATKAITKKIKNGGMIKFELSQFQSPGQPNQYSVNPDSIKEVFLGFE